MKGGLILTPRTLPDQTVRILTGFAPVIEMIQNGKIILLSNMSISGIIFKLIVSEENSYYTNLTIVLSLPS